MSAEENKALVRRFVEAQAKCDLETLDELLAPDFVDHSLLPGQDPGREGYMQGVAEDHAAFSDIRTTIEYQATDGDMVITRLTSRSIHDRGEFLGVAPTGEENEAKGIVIDRIYDGCTSSLAAIDSISARFITVYLRSSRPVRCPFSNAFIRHNLENCVGVQLVYKESRKVLFLLFAVTFNLQSNAFAEWAMLGSNQRPLPCESSTIVC